MGDSKPPQAQFDLVGSHARRRGAEVELVFVAPDAEIAALTSLVLRRAGRDVTATLEHGAERSTARAPRAALTDGIWNIRRSADGGDDERLNARLLVQGDRPLVLLWGGTTPGSVVPKAVRHLPAANRIAAHAGSALDTILGTLPEETGTKIRRAVRSRARRALG